MATPAPTPSLRQRRHSRWAAAIAVLLVVPVLLVIALLGTGWWLVRSDHGPAWLLSQVPGLRITGLQGALDGGPLRAARVEWRHGTSRLLIEGLEWRDLWWQWRPHRGAWMSIGIAEPRARRVEWTSEPAPRPAAPARPPADLRLPAELVLQGLRIDALQIDQAPPITQLGLDAHVGADGGARHVVSRLQLDVQGMPVRAQASIAAAAPMVLQAEASVASPPDAERRWSARATAEGPLERPQVEATLRVPPGAALDASATLAPFAPWPLAALQARTQDLNLADLAPGLPATKLSGGAVVQSSAMDAPVQIDLRLANALPGRWDEGRLPARALTLGVRGRPDARQRLELTAFEADLGARAAAGRITGSGVWDADRLQVELAVQQLLPAALDRRLAAMRLAGPLALDLRGLPSPAGGTPAQPRRLAGTLNARLDGRLERRDAPPVRVAAAAAFDAGDDTLAVEVQQLDATAGGARLRATATARRDAAQQWRLVGRGDLQRFDPAPWWPGATGPQRGPTALNGSWSADLALPQAALGAGLPALLRGLRGQADMKLADSRLAGVALQGATALRAGGGTAQLQGSLQAAANRAAFDVRAAADPGADRWNVKIDAPALQALAPWGAMFPALRDAVPQAGTLSADAQAEGRWPALRTQGRLDVNGLRTPAWRIDQAAARWTAATGRADAPLSATLQARGVARGEQRLDTLRADLGGSLAAHRLTLDAASPIRPPAWSDGLLGGANGGGTALRFEGNGTWTPERAGGGLWRAQVARLTAAPRAAAEVPWVAVRGFDASVRFDAAGAAREASAAPGRIELLGAVLRWREAAWTRGDGATPARTQLDAELEPLKVAPWLAKLHPSFGWGGDLTVQGRFKVRSAERFEADLVLERTAGDLSVTDEGGTQSLNLTDLRFGMLANEGTWHFTQAVAGTNIGVLGGAQSLRVSPQATWPAPDTPLEGVVELRVANLGVWAPWLPPGWRLGGQLRTSASLGGRFGAPEYTGEMVGSGLAIRNLLQGVDVRDGDLAVTLRGADAKVERFVFRGGDGTLRLAGGASFGATPRAQLQLTAERFQVLGRVDRRIVASGDATLALEAERIRLDGRFKVDEGLIDVSQTDAPQLDDDVVVVRRGGTTRGATPAAEAPPVPPARNPLRNAQVALRIALGDDLRLRGRGLDARLGGELRISTPNGQLAVEGGIRTIGGTYVAYGQRLLIERGQLFFGGEVANPRLDIVAVRPNLDIKVGVGVQGTAQSPRVRLISEPEMSELDKLSWLVMGRGSEGLGRTDTALLQRAAIALLAGSEGGGPTEALLRNIGLDDLSVRQTETGDVRDTVVSLGKQISQRWYVGYERGVNATTGTWQLIYRIAQRFTLRAQSGAETSLDVIWSWRW